jgi:surface antigen
VCNGAVHHNIDKITDAEYHVRPEDYTILCDASQNKIKVVLPPAVNNNGRVLIIKKTNSDKYKINSNQIEVSCEEGNIDINDKITIKMNYSSRTLQSDGENWWIIGTKGS